MDVALSRNALPANSEMRKEFELLKPLLSPMSPDVDQNELEKNASFLQSDKQLKLHKVICNFPTGLQILESSAQAISAKKKDALLQIKLQTLTATDHNVTVDEQNSLDYMVMAANPLRKVFEQYCEALRFLLFSSWLCHTQTHTHTQNFREGATNENAFQWFVSVGSEFRVVGDMMIPDCFLLPLVPISKSCVDR